MTELEKDVLRQMERRIDTVAFVISHLAERAFTDEDRKNIGGLADALDDCQHELRAVQVLAQP